MKTFLDIKVGDLIVCSFHPGERTFRVRKLTAKSILVDDPDRVFTVTNTTRFNRVTGEWSGGIGHRILRKVAV